MKRLLSILLALVLVLGLSVTAFAQNDAVITINDAAATRTYDGYQLLTLTVSLKQGERHTEHQGAHTDDCYNYAYSVNDDYLGILQNEVFAKADTAFWGKEGKPAAATDVTDAQILDYLSDQTSDNDGGSLRAVADRIYRAIKAAPIAADVTEMTGVNDKIGQGYWLIADVTNLSDKDEANSLVMLDTKGELNITVAPKTALPTFEKKVKDITDSTDADIKDNAWQDSADHDINDIVPFKLTATLPSNFEYYTSYQIAFHDTLSAGLTFDADSINSIQVYQYASKADADADVEMDNFTKNVTTDFTITTSNLTDGCSFEVSHANIKDLEDVTKDTVFVVYYEAKLNDDAVIGAAGNPNNAYLKFSNDPYSNGTGKIEDKVVVFTYQVVINKVDSHNDPLKGAGFTLYKKSLDDGYKKIGEELKGDDMTTFEWTGLDDGEYKLEETTVPLGYNKMEDIEFTITAEHDTENKPLELTELDGGDLGTGVVSTGAITKQVENKTGTVLPETGARGTVMMIGISAMVVMVAGVFMITRKRMSIYED